MRVLVELVLFVVFVGNNLKLIRGFVRLTCPPVGEIVFIVQSEHF